MNKSNEKHIAIWGAWYGSRNVGDRAVLLTIARMLRHVLGNVRLTVFTDNPTHVLDYAPQEPGLTVEAFQNRRQFHRLVQTLLTCDLFVIGGGVPFYQQRYHLWVLRVLVSIARLARTPYMTWAVSSQSIDQSAAKKVFKWILDDAAAVTYRDRQTGEMFRACGVARPMTWVADPVFRLPIDDSPRAQELIDQAGERKVERPLSALVCRRMRYDHSYAAEHYNAKTPEMVDRVVECFAAALDWMWQQGYQPMIVPMNTVEPDDDRVMGRLVMRAAEFGDHALLIDQAIHPCVVPGILRHCQFGLTSRLHASVLATVANCPMAIYAIGPKLHGIAETMGTQDWTIDEEQATPGDVVELLRSMVTNIASIRALLAQRLVELRNQALTPAHVARDIVTGRTSGLD